MNWKHIRRDKSLVNEDLIVKAKNGDEDAKNLLFKNNLAFVHKMARKWRGRGSTMDFDDLMSIGSIALAKSYNKYNIESGYKFVTLLGKVIFNEFSYAARHQSSERFTKYETVSLDQIVSDRSESDYHEVIADNTYNVNNDENEFDVEYNMKQKMYLFNKIASKREKELLHKHYVENITITNIAKEWGITRQAASLLHRKCLDKIRNVGDVRISV